MSIHASVEIYQYFVNSSTLAKLESDIPANLCNSGQRRLTRMLTSEYLSNVVAWHVCYNCVWNPCAN